MSLLSVWELLVPTLTMGLQVSLSGITSIELGDRPLTTNLTSAPITVRVQYQPIKLGGDQDLDSQNLRYQILENGQIKTEDKQNTLVFGRVFLKDLNRDGIPEVIVETFSGGAHCCTNAVIYTKHQGQFRKVETGPKDGGGIAFQDLDGDGSIELVSRDQSFYYAYSSYVSSVPPSQIFSLQSGKLVDTTRKYPRYLRAELQRMFEVIKEFSKQDREINGILAGYVAQKALLGEFAQGWQVMLARYDRVSDWGLAIYNSQGQETGRYRDFPTALRSHLKRMGYLAK